MVLSLKHCDHNWNYHKLFACLGAQPQQKRSVRSVDKKSMHQTKSKKMKQFLEILAYELNGKTTLIFIYNVPTFSPLGLIHHLLFLFCFISSLLYIYIIIKSEKSVGMSVWQTDVFSFKKQVCQVVLYLLCVWALNNSRSEKKVATERKRR